MTPAEQRELEACGCRACNKAVSLTAPRFFACEKCGNKRCPHATNHIHDCTRSNEPGQLGSIFGTESETPIKATTMTTLEKAAKDAAKEIAATLSSAIHGKYTPPAPSTIETAERFVLRHLEPVKHLLESRQIEAEELEEIITEAHKLFPNDDGWPAPTDDALHRIKRAKAELDEARELMSSPKIKHERITEREPECWPSCIKCQAQRWLERNEGGK